MSCFSECAVTCIFLLRNVFCFFLRICDLILHFIQPLCTNTIYFYGKRGLPLIKCCLIYLLNYPLETEWGSLFFSEGSAGFTPLGAHQQSLAKWMFVCQGWRSHRMKCNIFVTWNHHHYKIESGETRLGEAWVGDWSLARIVWESHIHFQRGLRGKISFCD